MTLKEKLQKVLSEKSELQNKISSLTKEEISLREQIFQDETGVKIGKHVLFKSEKYLVVGFDYSIGSVRPLVSPYKKDGSLSAKKSRLYYWDLKEIQLID